MYNSGSVFSVSSWILMLMDSSDESRDWRDLSQRCLLYTSRESQTQDFSEPSVTGSGAWSMQEIAETQSKKSGFIISGLSGLPVMFQKRGNNES